MLGWRRRRGRCQLVGWPQVRGWLVRRAGVRGVSRPHWRQSGSRLPSRAARAFVGAQPGADCVADPSLQAAQCFLVGLPFGDFALVVGPAVAVGMRDLSDRGHMDRVIEPAVAAQRQLVDLLLTLGISAAHASQMHDPACNFHPVQLDRVFLRSVMASPDTTSGMASAPQTGPATIATGSAGAAGSSSRRAHGAPRSTPSRVMDSAGERSHARTHSRNRRQTAALSAPGALPRSAFSQRHSARRQCSVMPKRGAF
jgi:hypothetical protein